MRREGSPGVNARSWEVTWTVQGRGERGRRGAGVGSWRGWGSGDLTSLAPHERLSELPVVPREKSAFLLKIDPNTLYIIQKFRSLVAAARTPSLMALIPHLPSEGLGPREQ